MIEYRNARRITYQNCSISHCFIFLYFYFLLSSIRLCVLCRTDQLTVNFAYVEATFIMCILNLCCTLIVFMFRTVFSVILCCYVYCFLQMCNVLLPAGDNPTAGNKRIYTVTSFVAPRSSPHFSTLSHKRHNFRKKNYWT